MHNLLFTENGTHVYIIPRKHYKSIEKTKADIKINWLEVCGVITCLTKPYFDNFQEDTFNTFIRENVSISKEEFGELKSDFYKLFSNKFEIL